VVFKVVERADNGMTKTYPSNDVYNALNQANVKVSSCVIMHNIDILYDCFALLEITAGYVQVKVTFQFNFRQVMTNIWKVKMFDSFKQH